MKHIAIALVFLFSLVACQKADPQEAQRAAVEFARNYPDFTGKVACTQSDTDGDGYVTCTAFMKDGSEKRLDCGAEKWCMFNCARGCKTVEGVKLQGSR